MRVDSPALSYSLLSQILPDHRRPSAGAFSCTAAPSLPHFTKLWSCQSQRSPPKVGVSSNFLTAILLCIFRRLQFGLTALLPLDWSDLRFLSELARTVNHTHYQQLETVVRARVVSNSGTTRAVTLGGHE